MAAAAAAAPTACSICIEPLNKVARKQVVCPYCPTDSATVCCRSCVQRYLIEDVSPIPRCASCRTEWSDDFLAEVCTKTFLTKEYKAHREQILWDAERARLPEAQEDAARYKEACTYLAGVEPRIKELQERARNLPECAAFKAASDAFHKVYRERIRYERMRDGERSQEHRDAENAAYTTYINAMSKENEAKRPLMIEIRRLRTAHITTTNAMTIRANFGRTRTVRQGAADAGGQQQQRNWTFVMRCTAANGSCQGFVGTDWKCGLCATQFCADCCEEQNKNAADGAAHVCDPDAVATARAIRREAKPCPKCAALISKIDGCDQMWCTQCRTAFSWRTGAIEVHVHNPHYYQWMRERGQTPAPPVGAAAAPNDLCLTDEEFLTQAILFARRDRDMTTVNWCMTIRHYNFQLTQFRGQIATLRDDEWRRQLRVQRLVGKITDEEWKTALQKKEKKTALLRNVIEVLQVFCTSAVDILRRHFHEHSAAAGLISFNVFDELNKLRSYCNTQLGKIGSRFNSTLPPYITLLREDNPGRLVAPLL